MPEMINSINDDKEARKAIIEKLDKNLFVEAGAGSGKTTMLVSRMVALIEAGREIDKICAITFTKAAAAEFYKRFQERLSERSVVDKNYKLKGYAGELPAPTKETAELCAKALENIDLCFMGTIDSFCQMVLAEHPMEAGIPSDASIVDEDEMQQLFKDEYIKLLNGEYGRRLKQLATLFKSFNWNDEEVFLKGMKYIMERRNIHFVYDEVTEEQLDIDNYFSEEKNQIIELLNYINTHRNYVYDETESDWRLLPNYIRILSMSWSSNLSAVIRALKRISQKLYICDVIEYNRDVNMDLLVHVDGYDKAYVLGGTALGKLEELSYSVAMGLFVSGAGEIEKGLKSAGKLSFFDYLYYLRNMLANDANGNGKLTKHIYDRHKYFFIDEFQDTNPMQAEVFFHLTAKRHNPNWKECMPEDGSLFIVGDPKQSIYRFRCADVSAYIRIKKLFLNGVGIVAKLTDNFRSRNALKTYFNEAFTLLLDEEDENNCKFESVTNAGPDFAENPTIPDGSMLLEGFKMYVANCGNSVPPSKAFNKDHKKVCKLIKNMVRNSKYLIQDNPGEEPRQIMYKDIMVITPNKFAIGEFLKEFEAENIPYRAEGKVLFDKCMGLNVLYEILELMAKPYESISIIRALRSFIFKFSYDEIAYFSLKYSNGKGLSLYNEYKVPKTDRVSYRVFEKIQLLQNILSMSKKLTPAATCSMIIDELEIFKVVPAKNLEVLYFVIELVRTNQKNGNIITLEDCANYVKTLLSGESEIDRCLSLTTDDDYVHIANLHKVKGLEAPIVFLTYWYPMAPTPNIHVDYSGDEPQGYMLSCHEGFGKDKKIYFRTFKQPEIVEKEKEALSEEIKRDIYVAATRPRNLLLACKSLIGKKESFMSRWRGTLFSSPTLFDRSPLEKYHDDIEGYVYENRNPYSKNRKTYNADKLYEDASRSNILNDREKELESFEIKNPSSLRSENIYSMEDSLLDIYSDVGAETLEDFLNNDFLSVYEIDGMTEEEILDSLSNENTKDNSKDKSKKKAGEINELHRRPEILGSAVHRLLEMLVSSKENADIEKFVSDIVKDYASKETEYYQEKLVEGLKQVANIILHGGYSQENKAPKDIYQELISAEEVYCEVPFSYRKDNDIWNGIIDVIYKKNDEWHIIDYKTNVEDENLDMEYKEQLKAYQDAFKKIYDLTADAYIYHVDI